MRSSISGFTLIELVAVVVILGVLAATAVPRFLDLSDAAQDSAMKNVAGALTSAASLNHAKNIAFDAGISEAQPTRVRSCTDAASLLEGGLDDQYFIETGVGTASTGDGVATEGDSSVCRVAYDSNGDGSYSRVDNPRATFIVYGVN